MNINRYGAEGILIFHPPCIIIIVRDFGPNGTDSPDTGYPYVNMKRIRINLEMRSFIHERV